MPIYRSKQSEAEIQAELYHRIRSLGFNPRLQVPGFIHDGRKCLFDIVVFIKQPRLAICIIECKRGSGLVKNMGPSGKAQWEKYSLFNLPLFYCGKNDIEKTVEFVRSFL